MGKAGMTVNCSICYGRGRRGARTCVWCKGSGKIDAKTGRAAPKAEGGSENSERGT